MKKIRKKTILYILIIFMIIASLFTTYAFLGARVEGNETSKKAVFNNQSIKVKYSDGTNVLTGNESFKPGSILTKTFTITNTGNVPVEYSINLTDIKNDFTREQDLTYEFKMENELAYNGFKPASGIFPKNNITLLSKNYLEIGESRTYTLTVNYLNSEENQIEDSGKILSAKIVIDEAIDALTKLNVYGNSIQKSTPSPLSPVEIENLGTGGNLFDISKIEKTTYITNTDGELLLTNYACQSKLTPEKFLKMTGLKAGDKITSFNTVEVLNGDSSSAVIGRLAFLTKNSSNNSTFTVINYGEKKYTSTIPENFTSDNYHPLYFYGTSVGDENGKKLVKIKDIMITKNSDVYNYVPYNKYEVSVNVSGNNLNINNSWVTGTNNTGFNMSYNPDIKLEMTEDSVETISLPAWSGIASNMLPIEDLEYISYEVNQNSVVDNYENFHIILQLYDENKNKITGKTLNAKSEKDVKYEYLRKDIQINTGTKYFRLCLVSRKNKLKNVKMSNIMISNNLENTKYEQPGTKYTLYLNQPLRKIGDCETCADYIDFKNGQIVRYINQIKLTGEESWIYNGTSLGEYGYLLYLYDDKNYDYRSRSNMLSSYFPMTNKTILTSENDESGLFAGTGINFVLNSNLFTGLPNYTVPTTTAEATNLWNSYLSENNIDLIYLMNNSKTETIDLSKIKNLTKDKRIIVCSGNDICASEIEVE